VSQKRRRKNKVELRKRERGAVLSTRALKHRNAKGGKTGKKKGGVRKNGKSAMVPGVIGPRKGGDLEIASDQEGEKRNFSKVKNHHGSGEGGKKNAR